MGHLQMTPRNLGGYYNADVICICTSRITLIVGGCKGFRKCFFFMINVETWAHLKKYGLFVPVIKYIQQCCIIPVSAYCAHSM